MREIKFKALHKPTGKVFPVWSIAPDYVFEDSPDGVNTSPTIPAKREDCDLFQYTGEKDRNGDEIYVGDTLRVMSCVVIDRGFEEVFRGVVTDHGIRGITIDNGDDSKGLLFTIYQYEIVKP